MRNALRFFLLITPNDIMCVHRARYVDWFGLWKVMDFVEIDKKWVRIRFMMSEMAKGLSLMKMGFT